MGITRLEPIVDDHAVADVDPCRFSQLGAGTDADPDHNQIGGELGAVVEHHDLFGDLLDLSAQPEGHAVFDVKVGDESTHSLSDPSH